MKIAETSINGVYVIDNLWTSDDRGQFIKFFNEVSFEKFELCKQFRESYYSVSKKNVLRGMHFQNPPNQHAKLVHVPFGAVLDVVLDLRKMSSTFGKCFSVELSSENRKSIYIPDGCAHGFLSLVDNTITLYNVTSVYNPESDSGVYWESIPFNWNIISPIISERDEKFIKFNEYSSPF